MLKLDCYADIGPEDYRDLIQQMVYEDSEALFNAFAEAVQTIADVSPKNKKNLLTGLGKLVDCVSNPKMIEVLNEGIED